MFYSLRLINKLDLIFEDRRGAERAQSANEKKPIKTLFLMTKLATLKTGRNPMAIEITCKEGFSCKEDLS